MRHTNPLKLKYPIIIRLTTLIGIVLVILNFLIFPRFVNTLSFETVVTMKKTKSIKIMSGIDEVGISLDIFVFFLNFISCYSL